MHTLAVGFVDPILLTTRLRLRGMTEQMPLLQSEGWK